MTQWTERQRRLLSDRQKVFSDLHIQKRSQNDGRTATIRASTDFHSKLDHAHTIVQHVSLLW